MTIKVTLEFATEDDLVRYFMRDIVQNAPLVVNVAIPTPTPVKTKKAAAKPDAPVKAEVPAARTAAEASVPPVAPAPVKAAPKAPNAPVQAVAAATLGTVRIALREVFNTKGAAAATDLLTQFGAKRVSDVKPEDFAKFVAACAK